MIADSDEREDYQSLRGFNGRMALSADQLQWRGLNFTQVQSEISNQQGLLTVSKMQGNLDGGQLSLPGTLDARGDTPLATFQPALQNVEIGSLIKAFNYSLNLTGKLSLSGEFSGTRIDADDFRRHWQGQAQLQMADTRTEGAELPAAGAAGRGAQHQRAGAGKLRQCHPPGFREQPADAG